MQWLKLQSRQLRQRPLPTPTHTPPHSFKHLNYFYDTNTGHDHHFSKRS